MTVESLAALLCVASGIFGRPALGEDECLARAAEIDSAARRHDVDPTLMLAIDVVECDLRDDVDAPIWQVVGGRRRRVGVDACPMGVRIWGPRSTISRLDLYERAADFLERWKVRHEAGRCSRGHHFVAHYNWGNPAYADQVLSVKAVLLGRSPRPRHPEGMSPRVKVIVDRLIQALHLDARVPWRSSSRRRSRRWRERAREAWDVAREVVSAAAATSTKAARLSWRESMRVLRKSILPGVVERTVGLVLVATFLLSIYYVLRLVVLLGGISGR